MSGTDGPSKANEGGGGGEGEAPRRLSALRGAIRVERNDRDVIYRGTQRLLTAMMERNALDQDQIVSAFFTMTPDLNADFPAYAARELGWTDVPMLGAQETAVPGALDRVVRVLLHVRSTAPPRHVYLGEAAGMRPDLAEEGDAVPGTGPARPAVARFGTLVVVGLGLIGGSCALALRRKGLFARLKGVDADPEAVELARRAGAVDGATTDPDEALRTADVVLLAIPVDQLVPWLEEHGHRLRRGTVVIDVGSTKTDVVAAMEGLPEGVQAVGAHPMAGSETGGMSSARPDLFFDAVWALVSTSTTGAEARAVVEAMVKAVGGRVLWTEAGLHDRTAAATSHLPYLLACALADHLAEAASDAPVPDLLGPGARDMLRLAGSDPGIMAGIFAANWPAARREAEVFSERLDALITEMDGRWREAAGRDDRTAWIASELTGELSRYAETRRRLLKRHADVSAGADQEEDRP
ncbi:MAG: chorismate mutase [Gemmatimonadota bacterium]